MPNRRDFLRNAALLSAATAALPSATHGTGALAAALPGAGALEPLARPSVDPETLARDEAYWRRVAQRYRIMDSVANLEAGYFGMMAAPVLAAYHRHIDRVNRESSYFARRSYPALLRQARQRVARELGAGEGEIAFTRGATEALQALIGQYKPVQRGDTIMYADLDYNAMQWAMNALAEKRGATVARLDIPEPASHDAIIAAYTAALDAHPRTRLLLLTHCNNKTGLLLPVKALTALAHTRGVDVVVDAAHSFGQVPLTLPDLGADFVGINLHKWVGAPVGAGVMYIRQDRLDAIDRAHADESAAISSIESRIHTGTTHFATVMTISDAFDFQTEIGVSDKSARLRYLRDRWAIAARAIPGVDILTPDAPALVGAITAFRLHHRGGRAENQGIANALHDEFGIFTVYRTGLAKGDCVRVTPALYNSVTDADTLVSALRVLAAR